jgi:hypothetical protein
MDKIKPSDLKKLAQKMIADGTMPKLDELLEAVAPAREKYKSQIEAAQKETHPGAEALKGP